MEIGKKYGCLTILGKADESYYKCQCKCGKIHYFDEKTILSNPKYCSYPMFISSRMTYSVKAANATYRKRKQYGDLMNVHFVEKRSDCVPSDEYCALWNQYKNKRLNKKSTNTKEKRYTVEEWDNNGKFLGKYDVTAISHSEALKKLYPNDTFELCIQTDIRNNSWHLFRGKDFNFRVSNYYGNSARNKTRLYKRISDSK